MGAEEAPWKDEGADVTRMPEQSWLRWDEVQNLDRTQYPQRNISVLHAWQLLKFELKNWQ